MVGVLGQKVAAPESYAPDVLERIARPSASEITRLGWDIWHAYELSWCVEDSAVHWVGWFGIPADSPATVESKSLKLYLNSLNHHRFSHHSEALENHFERHFSACRVRGGTALFAGIGGVGYYRGARGYQSSRLHHRRRA